jgi:hypothetical protein
MREDIDVNRPKVPEELRPARLKVEAMLDEHLDWPLRKIAKACETGYEYVNLIANERMLRQLSVIPTPAITYAEQVASATLERLDVLTQRANEGKDIVTASEFARWLTVAGLPKLIAAFSKDDGEKLDQKASALVEECNERFRTGSKEPKFQEVQLRSLQEQISNLTEIVLQQKAA